MRQNTLYKTYDKKENLEKALNETFQIEEDKSDTYFSFLIEGKEKGERIDNESAKKL